MEIVKKRSTSCLRGWFEGEVMKRHKKKNKKLAGKRTFGRGISKRGRGKGSRMGRGSVKVGKRNFMHIVKYEPERFGKKGFVSLKKKAKGINLRDVPKLSDKDEIDITKFGYGKVLGGGELSKPLKIKAWSFSKKAEEKIKKSGGEAIVKGSGEVGS